jgi:type I restriction enzyme, R subunit
MSFDSAEKYQSQISSGGVGFQAAGPSIGRCIARTPAQRIAGHGVGRPVVEAQLVRLGSGKSYPFDLQDAHEALRRLRPTPDKIKGLKATNQADDDQLVLGTTITKTIDSDSKSYSFKYIDRETSTNNTFHTTADMSVERASSPQTKRCDLVCFVNGIPFLIIENKRPTESLKKAGSQLIGYQGEDNIPHLFHFAQMLMTMNRGEARCATVATPQKCYGATEIAYHLVRRDRRTLQISVHPDMTVEVVAPWPPQTPP